MINRTFVSQTNDMKILVLERIGQMERVLAEYISQRFPDADVNFVPNFESVPVEQIITHVKECDIICVQSIFDDTTGFEKMVQLFWSDEKLRKPTYIIHSTQRLLEALNTRITKSSCASISLMLKYGMEVYNIYYKEYGNPADDNQIFRYFTSPNIVYFDTVKLWWDEANHMIWDERPYYVASSTHTYFKPATAPKAKAEKKTIVDVLTPKEIRILQALLLEMHSFTTQNKEDLEEGRTHGMEADEIKTLLAEKKEWLRVIEKMGIIL